MAPLRALLCALVLAVFVPAVAEAASPTLETNASNADIGGSIHDTATLSDGFFLTGTITFYLYGPDDPTCLTAIDSWPVLVDTDGSAISPETTPSVAGDYRWIASYGGDGLLNDPVSGKCGDPGESSTVARATPNLVTSASDAPIGGSIHDTATISGGHNPGGTVTFHAYGPGDAACATSVFDSGPINIAGGTAVSGNFTPSTAGTYRWKATYNGDDNNEQVSGVCGDPGESSTVSKFAPAISTTASTTTIGGTIQDTATLSGGSSPSGTVTFRAFGPDDASCTGAAAFTSLPVSVASATASSGSYPPTSAGAYRWIAEYSGDARNSSITSDCNAVGGTSIVKAKPTLGTEATNATVGDPIHNTATLADAHNPGGTIEFLAYGPANSDCSGQPLIDRTVDVGSDGGASSGDFTAAGSGTYRWKVRYSGHAGNVAIPPSCTSDTSIVAMAHPTLTTFASDAVIGGEIHDIASVSGG